jgi:2-C-methyl-D-erythritol 4-phosphate cytidylyltransferase
MAVALIVAAGAGERLGAQGPKAFVELGGRPMLEWSVQALSRVPEIDRIVVALPAGVRGFPGEGRDAGDRLCSVLELKSVTGGRTRSESVRCALAAAGRGDPVLVHDAARPMLTPGLALEVLAAVDAADVDAAVAATPVTDTIKETGPDRVVRSTLARAALWAVQTPQVFRRQVLESALAVPEEVLAQATDDAWLVERAGGRVVVVPAPRENVKVTTTLDLAVAELLLRADPA